MNAQLKTLGMSDLAKLLHRTEKTIKSDLCRKPHSLPPRLFIPGSTKVIWLESVVLDWIQDCQNKKPVGKPRLMQK